MKKVFKKELFMLTAFIILFLVVRSVHYVYHLNFSGDQAAFSTKALEIFRNKSLTLIGPTISINLHGRNIFQGPAIYYFQLVFLLLGRFDPVVSSYLFTIFCALMIVPLYYGTRWLLSDRAALIMTAIYTLVPYYINYTRFLWNPNFQLSLLPILIFLMGLFKKKEKSKKVFFVLSILAGVLLQFHYQFILILLGIFVYYFIFLKLKPVYFLIYLSGIIIGFSPLIIFELRNHFYNVNTLILFLKNYNKLDHPGGPNTPHHYVSISFFILLAIIELINFKKIAKRNFSVFFIIFASLLFVWAAAANFKRPETAFWAPAKNWNYLSEEKIYKIVKQENLSDYNIANLAYDNISWVPKYLLKRDGVKINYDDYWHEKYLFVISEGDYYLHTPAYEVRIFEPFKVLKKWPINPRFDMYLLERIK